MDRACNAWDGTGPGRSWDLNFVYPRPTSWCDGVCARAESYCSEKINERGEVFKEKDYTICTKNFHAMGQLKLKTCSLCSNVFHSTNCQIFVLATHVCFLLTRWKIWFMPTFCRIRENLICHWELRLLLSTMLFGYPPPFPQNINTFKYECSSGLRRGFVSSSCVLGQFSTVLF